MSKVGTEFWVSVIFCAILQFVVCFCWWSVGYNTGYEKGYETVYDKVYEIGWYTGFGTVRKHLTIPFQPREEE